MSNEIQDTLLGAGFLEEDVRLAQKLTRRGLESHLNLTQRINSCERCALSHDCHGQLDIPIVTTQRLTGTGPWNSPFMIIGEMPGEHEAKYGVPFLGAEGQLLTMILAKAGIDRNAIYMTYAVKCAGTRQPTVDELIACRRHIDAEVEAVNPQVILTIGDFAMRAVNAQAASVHNSRNEVWVGSKRSIVHTHSMSTLLNGPDKMKHKAEVWQDITLAVTRVKEFKPNYTYDRVGLKSI
jgi:DNA polymerase